MGSLGAAGRPEGGFGDFFSGGSVRGASILAWPISRSSGTATPGLPASGHSSEGEILRGSGTLEWYSGCGGVYVRSGGAQAGPLRELYAGPYKVLRHSQKVFELQVGDRVETVAADRLKPHTGADPAPAQPPRRGRLPGSGGCGRQGSGLEGIPVETERNP